MRQEMMGFWDAVASAGPYANDLHLALDRQAHQHLITNFYRRMLFPRVAKHWWQIIVININFVRGICSSALCWRYSLTHTHTHTHTA